MCLELKLIAQNGANVDYFRNPYLSLQLRDPAVTASIWPTGKIVVFGAKTESAARVGSRRIARMIQKLGFVNVKFKNFRVTGVNGCINLPFRIKHIEFAKKNRDALYEPELNVGDSVDYQIKHPCKARMSVFSSGKITFHCSTNSDTNLLISYIVPMLYDFRKLRKKRAYEIQKKGLPSRPSFKTKKTNENKNNGNKKRSTRRDICYQESDDSLEKNSKKEIPNMLEEESAEISEYERLRQRNISERMKLLKELKF